MREICTKSTVKYVWNQDCLCVYWFEKKGVGEANDCLAQIQEVACQVKPLEVKWATSQMNICVDAPMIEISCEIHTHHMLVEYIAKPFYTVARSRGDAHK